MSYASMYMYHYHSLPISKCGLVYAIRNPNIFDAPKHPRMQTHDR
jgi:hypothetical protein